MRRTALVIGLFSMLVAQQPAQAGKGFMRPVNAALAPVKQTLRARAEYKALLKAEPGLDKRAKAVSKWDRGWFYGVNAGLAGLVGSSFLAGPVFGAVFTGIATVFAGPSVLIWHNAIARSERANVVTDALYSDVQRQKVGLNLLTSAYKQVRGSRRMRGYAGGSMEKQADLLANAAQRMAEAQTLGVEVSSTAVDALIASEKQGVLFRLQSRDERIRNEMGSRIDAVIARLKNPGEKGGVSKRELEDATWAAAELEDQSLVEAGHFLGRKNGDWSAPLNNAWAAGAKADFLKKELAQR